MLLPFKILAGEKMKVINTEDPLCDRDCHVGNSLDGLGDSAYSIRQATPKHKEQKGSQIKLQCSNFELT